RGGGPAAVRLPQNDGNFGNRGRSIGEEHFCSVTNDAAALLLHARHKARHIDQSHQWNVEDIAETYKTRCLVGRINVQSSSLYGRVVGDEPDHNSLDAGEAYNNV